MDLISTYKLLSLGMQVDVDGVCVRALAWVWLHVCVDLCVYVGVSTSPALE